MASGIVESSSQGSNPDQQQQGKGQAISRSKLIQRLLATSGNLPAFLNDLIMNQATMVAGTEAAGFVVERGEQEGKPVFALKPIAHIRPDDSDADTRNAAITAFQEIVQPCIQQNRDGAIQVSDADGAVEPQFCLVTLLRSDGEVVAASAVITRCRDMERAHQRLQSMQLVAGYFDLYTLRRTAEQSRQIAQSHQHVLQLATAVGTADGFNASAMNLCNELATRTGATRVSIGWVKGNKIKVQALSHTEQFDKKQELIVQLQRAMEECLDQEEVVQYEPGPEGGTTQNVTREAASLSRAQGGNTVISLPLRRPGHHGKDGAPQAEPDGDIVGVISLEFAPGTKLAPQAATGLAVAADLLAPQLYDRYQNDRWLITKAGISVRDTAKLAIGPRHMLAKTIIVLLLGLAIFSVVYRPTYRVAADFKFIPAERRLLSSPFETQIEAVHKKPGDIVTEGEPILTLKTYDLDMQRIEAEKEAHKYELERVRLESEVDDQGYRRTAEANEAAANRDAAQARANLLKHRIENSTIRAPFTGVVLQGDLEHRIGASVKQGDVLVEFGRLEKLKAELKVADRDIQDLKIGQKGQLATLAFPNRRYPLTVENIVPKPNAEEGDNRFTVYATLDEKDRGTQWLPGETGEARVEVGPKPLIWIWTHRLIDWVQLKAWQWLPV